MKLTFYFDVHPWTKEYDNVFASTQMDTVPTSGGKRYRVTVEVQDPLQPDVVLPDQKGVEVEE